MSSFTGTSEIAELHDLIGGLRRCVGSLKARYGDSPAMRRIVGGVKIADRVPPFTYGVVEPITDDSTDAVDSVTELINRAEEALEEAHKMGGNGGKLLAAYA